MPLKTYNNLLTRNLYDYRKERKNSDSKWKILRVINALELLNKAPIFKKNNNNPLKLTCTPNIILPQVLQN